MGINGNQKFAGLLLMVLLLLTEAILLTQGEELLRAESVLAEFTDDACESDGFRTMKIDAKVYDWICKTANQNDSSPYPLMASLYYDHDFKQLGIKDVQAQEAKLLASCARKQERKPEALTALAAAYAAVWADVQVFPVPESLTNTAATISFENSWQEARTYGGTRMHEGTDLMAGVNKRGYYPVVSMTDGTVEKVGWLPQGGYRIGIRAPHGGYFYYAHLASYAREFQEGDQVKAGDLLGMMGDTGYSEVEGTTGNFPVHLHVGIYIRTANEAELSVNPYEVLRYLEDYKLEYQF